MIGFVLLMAAQSSLAAPAAQSGAIDEVVVQGQRLYEMRAAIVAAEDLFYARYNELNEDDQFDIYCHRVKRTGSIREERACYPRIVDTATEAEGFAVWDAMQRAAGNGIASSGSGGEQSEGDKAARPRGTPASVVLAAKAPEYKENMLRLLRKSRDLRALVQRRDQLQRRYDAERQKRLNGKLVSFDID